MADNAKAIPVPELEVDPIERTYNNGPVMESELPAKRLIESQLQRARRSVDDRKIYSYVPQADPRHSRPALDPEDHALSIAADQGSGNKQAGKRNRGCDQPGVGADRLAK